MFVCFLSFVLFISLVMSKLHVILSSFVVSSQHLLTCNSTLVRTARASAIRRLHRRTKSRSASTSSKTGVRRLFFFFPLSHCTLSLTLYHDLGDVYSFTRAFSSRHLSLMHSQARQHSRVCDISSMTQSDVVLLQNTVSRPSSCAISIPQL